MCVFVQLKRLSASRVSTSTLSPSSGRRSSSIEFSCCISSPHPSDGLDGELMSNLKVSMSSLSMSRSSRVTMS